MDNENQDMPVVETEGADTPVKKKPGPKPKAKIAESAEPASETADNSAESATPSETSTSVDDNIEPIVDASNVMETKNDSDSAPKESPKPQESEEVDFKPYKLRTGGNITMYSARTVHSIKSYPPEITVESKADSRGFCLASAFVIGKGTVYGYIKLH